MNSEPVDIANEVALIMRATHQHIIDGTFMQGFITPHQYTTKKVTELITKAQTEARIDEIKKVKHYINTGGESFTEYYKNRLEELNKGVDK